MGKNVKSIYHIFQLFPIPNFHFNIKTTKQQQQTNYGQRKLGIIH